MSGVLSGPSDAVDEPPQDDPGRLLSGRLLARNTLFSLGGQAATIVCAVIAVPLLVDGLGTVRFGVLTLAWAVIGYAQVFDLGMGRALTKLTAERIGSERAREMPELFWTALAGMFALGVLVGLIVAALSPWLVRDVLNVPPDLEDETIHTFWLLAASLPLAISGAALRAHLEAWQRFDLTNAVVAPMAVVTYFGPVLVLTATDSLVATVGAVVASRVISWTINFAMVLHVSPSVRRDRRPHRSMLRPLLTFGGWVTATNVTNALMVAADRFVVGAAVSLVAVAYFATPYEVISKLWLVSIALAGVFFPAFALSLAARPERTATIFGGAVRIGFIALFPITLTVVTFSHQILDLWLNSDFAQHSERPLQWLAVGVLIASLSQIASGLVQSGRPDLTAKLALIELPLYLGAFYLALKAGGIAAAAAVWAAKAAIEAGVLYAFVHHLSPSSARAVAPLGLAFAGAGVLFAVAFTLDSVAVKAIFLALALAAFAPLAWTRILGAAERERVLARIRRPAPSAT
jgi:O-antigen/teichoic acid export membrane protein